MCVMVGCEPSIICLTFIVFLIYDRLVQQRQDKVSGLSLSSRSQGADAAIIRALIPLANGDPTWTEISRNVGANDNQNSMI